MTNAINNLLLHNCALNKVYQTHSIFQKLTADLRNIIGISFGYMKVFECGKYYTIQDDLDCLIDFVTYTKQSCIFAERNVTNIFDDEYHFTLWPKTPNNTAMKIYHKHHIWNGITISKINEDHIELYWFTGGTSRADWHKFFTRNKPLLIKFIEYFKKYEEILYLDEQPTTQGMFKFSQGFDISLPESEYTKAESPGIKKLITRLELDPIILDNVQAKTKLSKREIEVLSVLCHGYTMKLIAQKLELSSKTVECYLDRIKHKTGLHFKTDLIKFYEEHFHV